MKNQLKGHQGDVIFKSVDKVPAGAAKVENQPIAYGEHSGHQHCLTGDVEMYEFEGRKIAVVGSDGAMLQHVHESNITPANWKSVQALAIADHQPHLLPAGIYEFHIQNTYNPYTKLMEQVLD